MRIAIDVSQIVYGTGVSVYTRELTKALLKFDRKNEYLLYAGSLRMRRYVSEFYNSLEGNFTGVVYPIPPTLSDLLWNKLRFFKINKLIGKIDVLHSSDWTQPPTDAKKITTIHDLSPMKFPEETPKRIRDVHMRKLDLVRQEVDRIIVPSRATKEDLVNDLGFSENKIDVIPEAPAKEYRPQERKKVDQVKTKYRIHDKYILVVGTGERKNISRVLAVFDQVRHLEDYQLVVVGNLNSQHGVRGVLSLGRVPGFFMPALYAGAEMLFYPSLYEGFGLPILEAMACGTPVVTSNVSSMPEVAGQAAILVDPLDENDMANGIKRLVEKKQLYIERGKKRAAKFTWENAARQTLDVYSSLL